MDFKQYLKESLTSLGEGVSDVSRALIDFGKTYRPMYANEQVDETLNPREDWQKKTPDLDKQVKGLLELPMAVGAPLTPNLSSRVPRPRSKDVIPDLSNTPQGWDTPGAPASVRFHANNDPVQWKPVESDGPDTKILHEKLQKYPATADDLPTRARELEELLDEGTDVFPLYRIRDWYGFNYASDASPKAIAKAEKPIDNALHQLSIVTGLPKKAFGLREELNLRANERTASHPRAGGSYTPSENTIRVSPDEDVFAHEWFHALDKYLGNYFGKEAFTELDPATNIPGPLIRNKADPHRYGTMSRGPDRTINETQFIREKGLDAMYGSFDEADYTNMVKNYVHSSFPSMRPELRDKWADVLSTVYHPNWTVSMNHLPEKRRTYYNTPTERGARLFDAWVQYRSKGQNTPFLTKTVRQGLNNYDFLPTKPDGSPDYDLIKKGFDSLDAFFNEIRVRGATRSDGKKIVELFGGAAPFGMLAGMPDDQTQKKATPPKDITKGWTSPFDEEDKKFIDRPLDTLKEKRVPSKLWDDYWSTQTK